MNGNFNGRKKFFVELCKCSQLGCVVVHGASLTVLCGYLAKTPRLHTWFTDAVPMSPSTAILIVILSLTGFTTVTVLKNAIET